MLTITDSLNASQSLVYPADGSYHTKNFQLAKKFFSQTIKDSPSDMYAGCVFQTALVIAGLRRAVLFDIDSTSIATCQDTKDLLELIKSRHFSDEYPGCSHFTHFGELFLINTRLISLMRARIMLLTNKNLGRLL